MSSRPENSTFSPPDRHANFDIFIRARPGTVAPTCRALHERQPRRGPTGKYLEIYFVGGQWTVADIVEQIEKQSGVYCQVIVEVFPNRYRRKMKP